MTTLEKIREEIEDLDDVDYDFEGYYKAVTDALQIIDKYNPQEEEWHKAIVEAFEPCVDVISRQAVFDLMRSLKRWCVRSEDGKFNNVGLLYDDVMFGIEKLPSVRAQETKTGHWIQEGTAGVWTHNYECSECGGMVLACEVDLPDYCGHCGARMESEE